MSDPIDTLRVRTALEASRAEGARPIRIGRFAPYPVWMIMFVVVRGAQLIFLGCFAWWIAALFAAVDGATMATPSVWVMGVTAAMGASGSRHGRWRLSPLGDAIASMLASEQCPACGQSIFDHTPSSGYAPEVQKHRPLLSSVCTNCGQALSRRTAS